MGTTTIKVKDATIDRLKALGKMGDSYDDVINKLLVLEGELNELKTLAPSLMREAAELARESRKKTSR